MNAKYATPAVIKENANAENENPPKRRSTRITRSTHSLVGMDPSPEKPSKKQLPFVEYKGTIKYFTQGIDIAAVSDELMQWVNTQGEVVPIAFDMEWPFSFQTGPGKSALIQLCADEKECYLFHLTELKRIPSALMALLSNSKVRLHGVNIKNDIRKLKRDFPEVTVDVLIENCIDLGSWCNQVCNTGGRWSLDRLSKYICEKAVDKNKKVRMSKWHVVPLDNDQKLYAAIDVYILTANRMGVIKMFDIRSENEEPTTSFLISCEDDRKSNYVSCLAYHPTQKHIVLGGSEEGSITVWDLRQPGFPASYLSAHNSAITEVGFHKSEPSKLFTASENGEVWQWTQNSMIIPTDIEPQMLRQEPDNTNPWLNGERAKSRINVTSLITDLRKPVNSFDSYGTKIVCGSDSEAIYFIDSFI